MTENPLILFDGVCNFCNYWVNFASRHDQKKRLRFASLQGETAREILPRYQLDPSKLSSVILVDNGKAYTQSSACLRICKYLGGGWKLVYALMIIPKFLRDAVYNLVARNRYRWFGKKDSCMIPPADWKDRFFP